MLVRQKSELGTLVGEPGETLQGTLYRTLLEMILFGFFERGARLYPQQLAEQFDVSLTPVREALMRLATEGYIEAIPRRGFHVRVPTAKQIVDLWQARLGLELTAGELLFNRLSVGGIADDALEPVLRIQAELDGDGIAMTHHRHIQLNGDFHQQLVALSGNALIVSIYDGIQMQLLGAWVAHGLDSWRARFRFEGKDHRNLLKAIKKRDHSLYAKTLREHIGRSLSGALDDLQNQIATENKSHPVPQSIDPRMPAGT